jgi:DNA adenine methylase
MFPLNYERYAEVFGGAGWVLFYKPPSEYEVYNDRNGLLMNLYRCVRDSPAELIERLRFVLNSREDFERIRDALARDSPCLPDGQADTAASDVERAALFYQVIRHSYAGGLKSYASQPHDFYADFPLINRAHRRLRRVVIENQDFERLIGHYDRPTSFFYCDPPYFETEGYYSNIGDGGFGETDHVRLRNTLLNIKGKFLLSYNDCAFVRELYDAPDLTITEVSRLNTIKQRYDSGAMFDELLIANYDTGERARQYRQLNLFDCEQN